MTDKTDSKERELMAFADAYADASFSQGLEQKTEDQRPEAAREKLVAALRDALTGRASLAASAGSEPVAWTGGEEWEQLAWHLCAEEHGEDACDEVIWEGGPIPEPWGARWMKYESDAKRMIELVRRFYTPPSPPEGMVMVPKEPTEDMLEAVEEEVGGHCYSCSKWRASYDDCRRIWAAMIAAIPPTSSADSRKGE